MLLIVWQVLHLRHLRFCLIDQYLVVGHSYLVLIA
ncbi:hypothetical protein NT05LM_2680, partial [Listeria marthii FSL S4-120]